MSLSQKTGWWVKRIGNERKHRDEAEYSLENASVDAVVVPVVYVVGGTLG